MAMKQASVLSAADREVYTGLLKWMCTSWFSMPITANSIMTIAYRYTPEEAEYLTGFLYRQKHSRTLPVSRIPALTNSGKKSTS